MTEITQAAPGRFCWPELSTTDPAAAKAFYGALLGWAATDDSSDAGTYTLLRLRGLDVAALYQQRPDEKAHGVPPHWNTYVAVASADDAAAKARALGGTVLAGPFDVLDHGRISTRTDDPTHEMLGA